MNYKAIVQYEGTRYRAGRLMPSQGLMLMDVEYSESWGVGDRA